MSTDSLTTYRTSFNMFVPCDRETYRKLKRIRHLANFAEAEQRRWDRSQRRLAHNRGFKRRRSSGKVVWEPVNAQRMIFAPFYELWEVDPALLTYPRDGRLARETELLSRFFHDYKQARHPKPAAAEVVPMSLSRSEIDQLLTDIELWQLRR